MKIIALTISCFYCLVASGQQSLPSLIEQTKPAIVHIITYDYKGYEAGGTGFFIDTNGTCATAYHVLANAKTIYIETVDSIRYEVDSIVAQNKKSDLLIFTLKEANKKKFSYLKLSNKTPKQGEDVFIIGHPQGYAWSASNGIVSAVRTNSKGGEIIQITVPSSRGSSGSPVINMQGVVVGIMSFVKFTGQNLNFAASVNVLKTLGNDGSLYLGENQQPPPNPLELKLIIDSAETRMASRKYREAIDILTPLIIYDLKIERQIEINDNLASCYFFTQDYMQAYQFYDRVFTLIDKSKKKTPKLVFIYSQALHRAGMCQFQLGITVDSKEAVQRAIKAAKAGYQNDPLRKELYTMQIPLYYHSLAIIHLALEETSDACINLKLAVEWGNEDARADLEKYCEK